MCTRYVSPQAADIERLWQVGRTNPWRGQLSDIYPSYRAPFIRAADKATPGSRELVEGIWNLIPWFAKTPKQKFSTHNARFEELSAKASYKHPWARGQRCVVPAQAFYEPDWRSGKHVPWRFRRVDGDPWGLAGLFNTWTDKATGEVFESFTLLTVNADLHPTLNQMHRPDLTRPAHMQDKRGVVPIERHFVDAWLHASPEEAATLISLPDVEMLDAGPAVQADPQLL